MNGGEMASTSIAKLEEHAEHVTLLVKIGYKKVVANDENFGLAEAAA